MPKATVTQETERIELKSCPPDGFVELRTLSFHEMNTRADIAARMYQEEKVGQVGKKKADDAVIRAYMETMNVAMTEYEFRNCIVDHNLEDENGNLIDFTRPMQAWRLDPKVGAEIAKAIDELNTGESDDDLDPLVIPAFSSSSAEQSRLNPSTDAE